MIMADSWIIRQCDPELIGDKPPMISPLVMEPVRYVSVIDDQPTTATPGEDNSHVRKVISYGVSSYGYDVRLQADPDHIKIFSNVFASEINPKDIKITNFATPEIRIDEEGAKYVLVPPHSYIQAPTIEYFCIPDDVLVIVVGKSTLARSALLCNVTPIEPGFEGNVVIEVANLCSSPVRCYLEEGIAQFCFFKGNEQCMTTYRDKAGKYQGQTGLTLARV